MALEFIRAENLCRYYQRGPQQIRAVDDVSLSLNKGDFVAVCGASGSGKSTLLNLLAGLDTPTSGEIFIGETSLASLARRDLARYRAYRVAMVFQAFNLISHRTAAENVEVALYFNGTPRHERRERAQQVLDRLGLADRMTHHPAELSGGEQQRVAIARALVKEPEILFADEPTGNLDHANTEHICNLLQELHQNGLTIVLVTHDTEMAGRCTDKVLHMRYGKLTNGIDGDKIEDKGL